MNPLPGNAYWGIGVECTLYEILSLRGGMSTKPYSDFEAEKERPSFRYGAAVHLPMQKMVAGIPLYAVNAMMPTSPPLIAGKDGTALPAFAVEIHYDGFPW